jgi:cobalt-zinc-cadmium efflux system protein
MSSHHHHHDHHHDSAETPAVLHYPGARQGENKAVLQTVLVLTLCFFFAELAGGIWTNSLALLSDAGHMLSDIAALGLALFALWVAEKPPHNKKSFGYYRAEILAAFTNGAALVAIAIVIFHEAYQRFQAPQEVKSLPMLVIAAVGLVINLAGAYLLSKAGRENINIRGVLIHVLGDALGSLGAIAAGAVIWTKGWMWFDPLVSVFIGSIIIYSAWRLLWDTLHILMQGVPPYIDLEEIKRAMLAVEGVKGICDLHIWTLTSHVDMLSAHVVIAEMSRSREILGTLNKTLQERYGVEHVTIQIEDEAMGTCRLPV